MKAEKGIVTFFDLEQFGFYRIRQQKDPEFMNGNIGDILSKLKEWVETKTIEQTVPWGNDVPRRSKAYCKNISYNAETGDYIFVVWKTVGDNSGNILGVLGDSNVDGVHNETISTENTHNGVNLIWGQPCYYWFMPEYNKLASIKFPSSFADTDLICQYIKAFVDYRLEHPNKNITTVVIPHHKTNKDVTIKRVTYGVENENYKISFKMLAKQTKILTAGSNIDDLCKKITHIVYRDTIESNAQDTRENWNKLWDVFGGVFSRSAPATSNKHLVELVVDGQPTPEEFKTLIDLYLDGQISDGSDESPNEWNNIGFKTQGRNGNTTWLDEYVYRHEIFVDPSRKDTHYSSSMLMSVIMAHRKDFVACLRKIEQTEQIETESVNGSSQSNDEET
ncbi:TPA: hypothetical protein PXR00_003260, partial [Yersinia enterocolitica]|nr:hypothetical protein [Yersinia enterocolitica]